MSIPSIDRYSICMRYFTPGDTAIQLRFQGLVLVKVDLSPERLFSSRAKV